MARGFEVEKVRHTKREHLEANYFNTQGRGEWLVG